MARRKGAVGEREFGHWLTSEGFPSHRGCQHAGGVESPDCKGVLDDIIHWEIKRVEKLLLDAALAQVTKDAGTKWPIVAHRKSRQEWHVTMPAHILTHLLRIAFADRVVTPTEEEKEAA